MIREKDFLEQVRELARYEGWLSYHTYRSTRSEPGFPDLVLVRPPRLIFAELKTEKGRVTPAQWLWLDVLGRSNEVEAYLWRPSDWDRIVKTLKRERGERCAS